MSNKGFSNRKQGRLFGESSMGSKIMKSININSNKGNQIFKANNNKSSNKTYKDNDILFNKPAS